MTEGHHTRTGIAFGAGAAAFVGFVATEALAHPGTTHVHSMAAGFAHPFSGLDHLLAMVAVGLWAGINGGRALWAWPLAFVSLMLVGGAVGASQVAVPFVEPAILVSLVVLGLAIAASLRAPAMLGAIVIGAFALVHGYAHGMELPAGTSAVGYMAGFAIATAILHGMGATAALAAGNGAGRVAVRTAGAVVACAGVALAVLPALS